MQKEKAMLYMYDAESASVVRHRSLLKQYEIIKLVSPVGWGFTDKDASAADKGNEMGISVNSDFLKALEVCDVVIVGDCKLYKNIKNDLYPVMLEVVQKGKNLICLTGIDKSFKEKLLKHKHEKNYLICLEDLETKVEIGILSGANYSVPEWETNPGINEEIYKIEIPVIFVMGVTEQNNKFEIQMILREGMQRAGYQISQVGTKKYCKLFDFDSIPQFMYNKNFSEAEKIILFNRYIKKIEKEQNPDAVIIGIPGGIMKISDNFTNGFGILAYEISQAVTPDYVIMSTFYDNYKPEYFNILQSISQFRFGYEIDSFVIANVQIDWEEILKGNADIYVKLDNEFINQKINKYDLADTNVFNILCEKDSQAMIKDVIDKLNSYSSISVL